MTVDRRLKPLLLLVGFALAGCEEEKPVLTLEVLAQAAERCGARELEFNKPGDASALPSFSYLDPGPLAAGQPTSVSACLGKALEKHRFESMTIRLGSRAPAVR